MRPRQRPRRDRRQRGVSPPGWTVATARGRLVAGLPPLSPEEKEGGELASAQSTSPSSRGRPPARARAAIAWPSPIVSPTPRRPDAQRPTTTRRRGEPERGRGVRCRHPLPRSRLPHRLPRVPCGCVERRSPGEQERGRRCPGPCGGDGVDVQGGEGWETGRRGCVTRSGPLPPARPYTARITSETWSDAAAGPPAGSTADAPPAPRRFCLRWPTPNSHHARAFAMAPSPAAAFNPMPEGEAASAPSSARRRRQTRHLARAVAAAASTAAAASGGVLRGYGLDLALPAIARLDRRSRESDKGMRLPRPPCPAEAVAAPPSWPRG